MADITVRSFRELEVLIERQMRAKQSQVMNGIRSASTQGAMHLKREIPVAHGELRESVYAAPAAIIVDAPHAAAVNNGSRPHWPPLAPLVEWVKLRGAQGLLSERQQRRLPGTSTRSAATGVAGLLRSHEHRGPAGFMDIDAPVEAARAIQRAIASRGTKPHHFIEKALPEIYRLLDREIRKSLKK